MKSLKILLILFIVLTAVVIVRNAWVCDDAYISYRVIDNFIHGYGLRWNTAERVQVFTHPLWMFFLSLFYFFTREIFITSIIVSIILVLISIYLVTYKISKATSLSLLAVTILCFSKAFIDFSTSGLENPATFLLLAIFFTVFINARSDPKKLLVLSFIAALGVLNRMDSLLLFFPALVYEFYKCLKFKFKLLKSFGSVIIGFVPFILWEIFSIIYYGFPFPNTAYAKLNTGIETTMLVKQGAFYLISSYVDLQDLITPTVVVIAIFSSFFLKEKKMKFIALGTFLYLMYIIKIGGCFMLGRFLAAPLFCSVIILSRCEVLRKKWLWWPMFIVLTIAVFVSPLSPVLSGSKYDNSSYNVAQYNRGISDERGFYYKNSSFLKTLMGEKMPTYFTVTEGKRLRDDPELRYIMAQVIGFMGFYAGSDVHIIDPFALSDPLLARIPVPDHRMVRVGHYKRNFPQGYLESVAMDRTMIQSPDLAKYYDELNIITRGELFTKKRFSNIWKINTGQLQYLLDGYKNNFNYYQ
ncbi:MAG: hypothetical protein KKD07_00680 [Candidatus Omnitrophica bacterium]|nr:hypothetical protein [Candidatus Omnitrophota bacterium]MBU1996327.1 hypothetical protein [Candidatus Omnitrophota bacterium]MBU4332937.1 hypothetical protein [Candidatus Omnitrophota bacterium]